MFWKRFTIRAIIGFVIMLFTTASLGTVVLLESKSMIYRWSNSRQNPAGTIIPFPVSVNSYTKEINENPTVDQFLLNALANAPDSKENWWNQVAAVFANKNWYQNLASPVSRIIVIWPGERKEEIAKNIGDILGWNKSDRESFQQLVDSSNPIMAEGKYLPGQYVAHRKASPADIKNLIEDKFRTEVLERYTPTVASQVPLEDAMIIASLLEREASDFENMREISGVIWNRLFINMPLQLDSTLQYVKGSGLYEPSWWPAIRPRDKFLESSYNTYKHAGLTPAPIANPSPEAVLAALNPVVTDCLFYFHTQNGDYHCSENYADHVKKLRSIYGSGS